MKKIIVLLVATGLLIFSGSVFAAPFQVSDSTLDVNWDLGGGFTYYTGYGMTAPELLDAGESFDFTFGQIFIPLAFGLGTATLTVDFAAPTVQVSDEADFFVVSMIIASGGDLTFGPSEQYSYGSGGLFSIDFNDLAGVQLGSWANITGKITNDIDPVPEPATLILLGSGLAGLAFYRRKRK